MRPRLCDGAPFDRDMFERSVRDPVRTGVRRLRSVRGQRLRNRHHDGRELRRMRHDVPGAERVFERTVHVLVPDGNHALWQFVRESLDRSDALRDVRRRVRNVARHGRDVRRRDVREHVSERARGLRRQSRERLRGRSHDGRNALRFVQRRVCGNAGVHCGLVRMRSGTARVYRRRRAADDHVRQHDVRSCALRQLHDRLPRRCNVHRERVSVRGGLRRVRRRLHGRGIGPAQLRRLWVTLSGRRGLLGRRLWVSHGHVVLRRPLRLAPRRSEELRRVRGGLWSRRRVQRWALRLSGRRRIRDVRRAVCRHQQRSAQLRNVRRDGLSSSPMRGGHAGLRRRIHELRHGSVVRCPVSQSAVRSVELRRLWRLVRREHHLPRGRVFRYDDRLPDGADPVRPVVRGHHERRRELRRLRLEHGHERLLARIVLCGREMPDLFGSRVYDLSLRALRVRWIVLRLPARQLGLHRGRVPRGVTRRSG